MSLGVSLGISIAAGNLTNTEMEGISLGMSLGISLGASLGGFLSLLPCAEGRIEPTRDKRRRKARKLRFILKSKEVTIPPESLMR
jgi:hypothetical protein